jgi:hypothetical protein
MLARGNAMTRDVARREIRSVLHMQYLFIRFDAPPVRRAMDVLKRADVSRACRIRGVVYARLSARETDTLRYKPADAR